MVKGDSESPDQYHVAVDDGTRAKAWDLEIGSEPYRLLTPGTFVHARVNLRNREQVTVEPVEPPAVARPLAEVAADQERAVTGGLPDPAALIMADEAAAVLGTPGPGQAPRRRAIRPDDDLAAAPATRPMLRVEVRHARRGRPVPPAARPVPGVADGYVLGQAAMLTVPPVTAIISIHGTVLSGAGLAGARASRGGRDAGLAAPRGGGAASPAGREPAVRGGDRDSFGMIDFNQY